MKKKQIGEIVFQAIKDYLRANGASMDADKFPKEFPVSYRNIYNIKKGVWTEKLLEKLPFKVEVSYSISIDPSLPSQTQIEERAEMIEEYKGGATVQELAKKYGYENEAEAYKFLRGISRNKG